LHAVVATRYRGRWIILDNRSLLLIESSELHGYQPLFTLDHRGVRQFVPPSSPAVVDSLCGGALG
jgi:hypothetical protein